VDVARHPHRPVSGRNPAYASIRIESVLNKTHSKFEYVIVNNCSTDRTLHIARTYAKQDPRVRVVTNKGFVSAAQNHNNAVREISPQSDYCKVVSADDYLFSSALSTLVGFAVEHPSVGIINSYQQSRDSILWKGLSESVTVMSGREACRTELLDRTPLFGTPTSLHSINPYSRRKRWLPAMHAGSRLHVGTISTFIRPLANGGEMEEAIFSTPEGRIFMNFRGEPDPERDYSTMHGEFKACFSL
jgi:glycosyltransferase involved in cell wall biosynthesis